MNHRNAFSCTQLTLIFTSSIIYGKRGKRLNLSWGRGERGGTSASPALSTSISVYTHTHTHTHTHTEENIAYKIIIFFCFLN